LPPRKGGFRFAREGKGNTMVALWLWEDKERYKVTERKGCVYSTEEDAGGDIHCPYSCATAVKWKIPGVSC
jgi:hypothetical protein